MYPPTQDDEHLRLLTIFHYVVAGLMALCGSFPLIHVAIGLGVVFGQPGVPKGGGPPPEIGWLFVGVGSAVVLAHWVIGGMLAYAGRCIQQRTHWVFCLVMAGIVCVFQMPVGTILGVFTFIVLLRESVKAQFLGYTVPRPAVPIGPLPPE